MWRTVIICMVIDFTAADHLMIRRSTYPPAGGGRWGRAVYPLGSHPQSRTFLMLSRPFIPTPTPQFAPWYPMWKIPNMDGTQWSPSVSNQFQFYHPSLPMYPIIPQPSPPPLFSSLPEWYQTMPPEQSFLTSMWDPPMQETYPTFQWYPTDLEGYLARSPSPLYGNSDIQTSGDIEYQFYDYQKTDESSSGSSVPIIYAMPSVLGSRDSSYGIQSVGEADQTGQPFVSRAGRKLMTMKPTNYRGKKIFEKLARGRGGAQIDEVPETGEMTVEVPDFDPGPQIVEDLTLEDILRREQELPSTDMQPANAEPSPPLKRRRPPLVFPQDGYFSVPSEILEPPRQESLIPFLSGIPFSKPPESLSPIPPSTSLEPPKEDGPLLFTLPIPTESSPENRSFLSEELEAPKEKAPAPFREPTELEEYLAKTEEIKIPSRYLELPKEAPAPVFNDKVFSTSHLKAPENERTSDLLHAFVRALESKEFS